jgi:Family of unknown function (DUF5752)
VPRAAEPFSFVDYEGLVMPIGRRATNLREFLDILSVVSLDVIQHHLHRAALHRRFDDWDYPNDFASWAAKGLEDLALAEKLAALDPYGYGQLEEAREAISSLVEDHLSELPNVVPVRRGSEFHFASGHYLALSSDRKAWTLPEMRDALAAVPLSSIFFHFHEARLRGPGEDVDDFSRWIEGQFGPHPVADEMRKLDFYFFSLDELRQRLVGIFDDHAAREAR